MSLKDEENFSKNVDFNLSDIVHRLFIALFMPF